VTLPTVGIVGAGQLARMMYQAAIPLGIPIKLLAASETDGAARVASDVVIGAPDSFAALRSFATSCDVVTFDHELVEPEHLRTLEREGVVLRPGANTAAVVVDKREQRAVMRRMGAPVPAHKEVASIADIESFAGESGWPIVLKAARGGYDGRGVWVCTDASGAAEVWSGMVGRPLLVEEFCDIEAEFAVQVARRPGGESVVYPAVDTLQRDGMFHESVAPSALPESLTSQAAEIAAAIANEIDCIGMLAVEFFSVGGRLITNELAARPHNTAHYTIEGCVTSQFENHLRAVCDLPLGSTELTAEVVATVNILGPQDGSDPADTLADMLTIDGAHVHLYGKPARPGRKLGHVTVCGSGRGEALERARAVASRASGGVSQGSR
jgi:5-(carboxyamino)imidazole ribonucleotide synthase